MFGASLIAPFEFTLYQWLVALVAGSDLSIILNQSSRLVRWPRWWAASGHCGFRCVYGHHA